MDTFRGIHYAHVTPMPILWYCLYIFSWSKFPKKYDQLSQ